MSELVKKEETSVLIIDSKTIQDFLFSTGTKLNDNQKNMFMQLAIRNQLDPFKREIHAIPYGSDFNIVTGYQVYIQRAEATGKLNGWHCTTLKDAKGGLSGAKIIIHRKDFDQPFEWEVSLAEFDKGQSNWKKMPEFMIKKVCIGQGFRLAFPNELGGMPYLQEELEDLTPQKPPIQPPQAKQQGETREPVSDDGSILVTATIEEITSKSGEAKDKKTGKPKPWTLYGIKADGQWYNTFDKKLSEEAQEALHHKVELAYVQTEKSKNLVKITMLSQPDSKQCTEDPKTCDRSTFDEKDNAFCDYDPIDGGNACKFQKVENA